MPFKSGSKVLIVPRDPEGERNWKVRLGGNLKKPFTVLVQSAVDVVRIAIPNGGYDEVPTSIVRAA